MDVVRRRAPGAELYRPLIEDFLELLASFLPGCMGPWQDQVEPLWIEGAELYGSISARRGLAAGEVIEEFQYIRSAVIRLLYTDPPGGQPVSLRELLRLNRVIDRGVTQAGIGHTDALFFSLFQGSGVPESLSLELVEEITDELDGLRAELEALRREWDDGPPAPGTSNGGGA